MDSAHNLLLNNKNNKNKNNKNNNTKHYILKVTGKEISHFEVNIK